MSPEFTIPELTEVVARVSALLGPRDGSVVQLDGGITNRNFRVNFGGTDYVVRLPGKRTELLGIDREAECIANKAAAELGIAPKVAALIEQPSCLVTRFIDGREMTVEELREPDDDRRGRAATCGCSTTRAPSCPRTSTRSGSSRSTPKTGREHGSEVPAGYDDALAVARSIEEAVTGPARSRAGALPTTTCSPRTSCATATGSS